MGRTLIISGGVSGGHVSTAELAVTWDEVIWAALTIGRPSTHHVFQHGASSRYEAIFRLSLVRMALEQYGPTAKRLRRTEAYKGLDPTEKGAVSYFLGMTFCKLFASKLLATPWLLHLDVFKGQYSASVLGRSRPDLFGKQTGTGQWHVFETKGRASKPSQADRGKAKAQANRLISIGGTTCTLHVGAFTYFSADALNFHWIDPPPEARRKLELSEIGDRWQYYYAPVHALWSRDAPEAAAATDRLTIALPRFDLNIRIHPLLAPFMETERWEEAQSALSDAFEQLTADGFQADGLKIESGPTWRQRQSKWSSIG